MNGATVGPNGIPLGQMGAEWSVSGAGDLNGDGKDELVWTNGAGQAFVWTMNGAQMESFAMSNGDMGAVCGRVQSLSEVQ